MSSVRFAVALVIVALAFALYSLIFSGYRGAWITALSWALVTIASGLLVESMLRLARRS
jgi:hypothetical protein